MKELSKTEVMNTLVHVFLDNITDDYLEQLRINVNHEDEADNLENLTAVHDWCLENENSELF
jgi:hypothetical protein